MTTQQLQRKRSRDSEHDLIIKLADDAIQRAERVLRGAGKL